MLGPAFYLHVKHATSDTWVQVGPNPTHWGFFHFKESVESMEKLFKSLGLETRIEEFQTDYDDR
jgi:hypothetical protein